MAARENLQQSLLREKQRYQSRRWFFQECGVGLGSVALHSLLGSVLGGTASAGTLPAGTTRSRPKAPHFAAKAKRVIFLFLAGAPSHLDLFDYKPELAKFDGKLPPAELLKGYRAAFINPNSTLLGPKFKFAKHGQCGAELSELLPHPAEIVDDIAIVKSMHDRRLQPRAGADLHEHRRAAVRPAEHGRVDDLRPGQRSRRTCRPSSSSAPARRGPAAARATGAAASCRRSTRACRSAARATRSSTSRTRPASTRRCSATRSTPSAA